MVAVFADEATVSKVLTQFNLSLVSIATLNSAQNTVISGQSSEIQKIVEILEQQGIKTHPLKVSHSFHSPLIDPILDRWEEIAQQFQFAQPKSPLVSNLTGHFFSEQQIPDAHYWRCQTRSPVRFKEGIDTLLDRGYELFVEIGPKPILCKLGQRWGKGFRAALQSLGGSALYLGDDAHRPYLHWTAFRNGGDRITVLPGSLV